MPSLPSRPPDGNVAVPGAVDEVWSGLKFVRRVRDR
jgi:hypothetical protein